MQVTTHKKSPTFEALKWRSIFAEKGRMEDRKDKYNKKIMNKFDISIKISDLLGGKHGIHVTWDDDIIEFRIMSHCGKSFCRIFLDKARNDLVIESLSVERAWREAGHGKKMMNMFISLCSHFGVPGFLFVEKGSWMQSWYERIGFKYHQKRDEKTIWMKYSN